MTSSNENLQALERLLSDFFDPVLATSNERKRQIDELLSNFSQQRDAWQHCLVFLDSTLSQYVMMYCLTVLESVINKQWHGLDGEHKSVIRTSLSKYLLGRHSTVPSFIRNKLAKLVVDIGRLDWPHFYPDFFSSILQVMQNNETVSLGLVLLQTTSEELACPREDLPVARKSELSKLLLQQMPEALRILGNILDTILDQHRLLVSATPPPSPTSRPRMIHGSPMHRDNLIGAMLQSPQTKPLPWGADSLLPLSAESYSLCLQGLNCLSHLFSWIPLSDMITPSLLSTVFHFAAFGCETVRSVTAAEASHGDGQQLGMLAMCCINELLAKNCVPTDFEDYLLQMFQQTFYLLQKLTKDSQNGSLQSSNKLDELDDSFIEKFTEFLRLFVSNHLRRFESNAHFPVLEFLSLLFKFTFRQTSMHCFFLCLDIWDVFLDYIVTKLADRTTDNSSLLTKYKGGIMSVLSAMLQKMQFQTNQVQLETLDDEEVNDDHETEWQHFLRQSNETVAKIAELVPEDVFSVLLEAFEKLAATYINLDQYVAANGQGEKYLNISGEGDLRQLHCILRDLASLLQTLGRLVNYFIGEFFKTRLAQAESLVNRLIQMALFNKKSLLYQVRTQADTVLKKDLIEIHSQTLATLQTFSCWVGAYYLEFGANKEHKDKCVAIVSSIVESVDGLFSPQVPEKIVLSAAHLLVSLVFTVRPPFLLEIPSIAALYRDVGQGGCGSLAKEVQLLIYRALLSYLVIRWPSLTNSDQRWEMRAAAHSSFAKQVFGNFLQLKELGSRLATNADLQEQAKPCIKMALSILTDSVDAISTEVKKSKEICHGSVQDCIQYSLTLFSFYISHSDVLQDIMDCCYVLVQALRIQMGVDFTGQMIETFTSLLTRDRLAVIIAEEKSAGLNVVERLLHLLELIVQEPGYTFKSLLPKIISVAIEHIYPLVAERSAPEVKMPLFALLSEILEQNWQHFFKSAIGAAPSIGRTADDNGTDEVAATRSEFVAIMRAFGESFLQPDITIFRYNLESLESLNSRWKLYHKRIFREDMLYQFVTVLMQVLLVKSHDLLQEEIVIAIHNMAAVNFDAFFDIFLIQFLEQIDYISDEQKCRLLQSFAKEKDLPSFIGNAQRFINDLRYYRLINLSLPAGTVNLTR